MSQSTRTNFLAIPEEFSSYKNSRIVIQPIPFDLTSSWLKGADKGPEALIEASSHLELYDIETDSEVYLKGIYTAPPINAKTAAELNIVAHQKVKEYLNHNKFVVTLGGEHSISLGPIKAHAEKFKNLSVLQLDAHTDLRDNYEGDKLSHACIMARTSEIVSTVVAVGIRSMDVLEKPALEGKHVFFADKIRKSSNWRKEVVSKLSEDVYLTLDLDVFDPSIMPSTGTPEPGGLGWYEVLDLIELVCQERKLVGFDVVELCPSPHNRAPDFLAAKLVYKVLGLGVSA